MGVGALWLFTDWIDRAFNGGWVLPVLGIIFLPWTTALYTVGYILGNDAAPWGWLGLMIGLFMDVALHAGSASMGRRRYASR
jgi:hypothetical protein